MSEPSKKSYRLIVLTAVLGAAVGVLFLQSMLRRDIYAERRVMVERGHTVLEALAAGLRAHGRMGRFQVERLNVILDELSQASDIVAIQLLAEDRQPIATAGDGTAIPDVLPEAPRFLDDRLVLTTRFTLDSPSGMRGGPPEGSPRGPGHGRRMMERLEQWAEDDPPLAGAPHVLAVAMDTAAMNQAIAGERVRFLISAGVCVMLAVLGAAFALARRHQSGLQIQLQLAHEQAAQNERLAQLGAGLAHETKNPLGVVRGLAQSIGQPAHDPARTRELADTIVDEVDRTVRQINAFLDFARPREPELQAVDLQPFLANLCGLLDHEAREKQVAFRAELKERTLVQADPDMLRRAVMNLLVNALRASESGGEVRVGLDQRDHELELYVQDQGRGIALEDLPYVAQPYFTRSEGGSGLGLAIVDRVARAHGWRMVIDSHEGQGARVALRGLQPATGGA